MTDPIHNLVAELAAIRQETEDICHVIMAAAPWWAVDEIGRARTYFDRPVPWQGTVTGRCGWLGSIAANCGTIDAADWFDSLRHYDAGRRVWVKP